MLFLKSSYIFCTEEDNKMDNDIPENQQDRKIAVSAIKHLDQSKKIKNILIAVVSLFKENWLYEKFSLFYLEIRYIIFKYRWD